MYQIYKLPDDYDFSYWSTPIDDLSRMQSISDKRAYEWSLTATDEEKKEMTVVTSLIPTHYFVNLAVYLTQSLHYLVTEHAADFDALGALYLQRVPEIEAGQDHLFILGFDFHPEKFVVSPVDLSGRVSEDMEAELVATHQPEEESSN